MGIDSASGRYRIGDHVLELRAPRLGDADSWRTTNLLHEKRLRPAFGTAMTDWSTEHSAAAWADRWWRARTDPFVVHARVLVAEDGPVAHVVGQVDHVGPDRRTGHVESSIWLAGVPHSTPVSRWALATTVLDVLRTHPEVPRIVAPVYVHNRPAIALLEAVGFHHVQTLFRLREYAGEPVDHDVFAVENSAASRVELERILDALAAQPLPARRAEKPSVSAAFGAAHLVARRLRARTTPSRPADPLLPAVTHTADRHTVAFDAGRDARYRVHMDGAPMGDLEVTVDLGTSTTEIIDRLAPSAVPEVGGVVAAACRAAAARQRTRRLTIALADRHATASQELVGLGFVSEGPALPSRGDERTPRESWTRLRE